MLVSKPGENNLESGETGWKSSWVVPELKARDKDFVRMYHIIQSTEGNYGHFTLLYGALYNLY